jgi:hypothetical protein
VREECRRGVAKTLGTRLRYSIPLALTVRESKFERGRNRTHQVSLTKDLPKRWVDMDGYWSRCNPSRILGVVANFVIGGDQARLNVISVPVHVTMSSSGASRLFGVDEINHADN